MHKLSILFLTLKDFKGWKLCYCVLIILNDLNWMVINIALNDKAHSRHMFYINLAHPEHLYSSYLPIFFSIFQT